MFEKAYVDLLRSLACTVQSKRNKLDAMTFKSADLENKVRELELKEPFLLEGSGKLAELQGLLASGTAKLGF